MNVSYKLINKVLTKKDISNVIEMVYRHCGQKEAVLFADRIMALGFKHAAKAGISFGKDDMIIPTTKGKHIADSLKEVKQFEQQYADGLITSGEKYNKVIDAWSHCTERVAHDMMKQISSIGMEEGFVILVLGQDLVLREWAHAGVNHNVCLEIQHLLEIF
jgi:DNA-directed RNA polymerase subunit beta'